MVFFIRISDTVKIHVHFWSLSEKTFESRGNGHFYWPERFEAIYSRTVTCVIAEKKGISGHFTRNLLRNCAPWFAAQREKYRCSRELLCYVVETLSPHDEKSLKEQSRNTENVSSKIACIPT